MFGSRKNSAQKMLENSDDYPPSSGRVREWRLGMRLVSIPCHIEPDVRFSLIRLSDNLLPAAFKFRPHIFRVSRSILNPVQAVLFLLAARYSLRWNSRDLSWGVVGLPACTVTYFLAEPG